MRKILLSLLLLAASAVGQAQTKITLAEVPQHVGDSVQLSAKIYGVKSFGAGSKVPVLLNLGADFPNQLLTIAVFNTDPSGTATLPGDAQKGQLATVTGKIELYKGRPQIAVRSADQLTIVPDAGTPTAGKQER